MSMDNVRKDTNSAKVENGEKNL